MKLELKRVEKINGEVFFYIYADDTSVAAFYLDPSENKEGVISNAENKALELYNKIKERGSHKSVSTLIKSEEI